MACALTGDRIHWLMSLGTGLAGTQASFSCFLSGHLWAPFTVYLLNWSRTIFFFFFPNVSDCYSAFALAPGPFSNVVLGNTSSGWCSY